MPGLSRQTPYFDVTSLTALISVIWFIIIIGVLYWFYRTMKRIEQALQDIKKLLENKASVS
jgi:Na+/H+ antiporter NhaD/arsenite permease-like protein